MKDEREPEAIQASFISANGENGFFSLYDEVFDPKKFDKLYVITGGPGTGKSTLLRRIRQRAVSEGCITEQILCSSDPSSLDGVIIEKNGRRVGVLDGTPPHGRIPKYPAVTEEIIHLGLLWDSEKLRKSKDVIFTLTEKKQRAYACAYALLSALGKIHEEERLRAISLFDEEKAGRQIKHKLQSERRKGEQKVRLFRAFSSRGETILPFGEQDVKNLLLIGGKETSAEIYLNLFAEKAKKERLEHTVFLSPLSSDFPDGVYFPETQTLLIKERLATHLHKGRRIIADRFFSFADNESKELTRPKNELIAAAFARLEEAATIHRAMEAIYGEAMNFSHFDTFAESTIQDIFAIL